MNLRREPLIRPDRRPNLRHRKSVGEGGEPELPPGLLGSPSAKPGTTYRLLRRIWILAAWALRVRLIFEGAEHLPRDARRRPVGGWIAAVVPHRTWIDPFVPWILLAERPRFAFFGDARTMARSPLRRFVVRRLGGVIPIPARPDTASVQVHLDAAAEAIEAGMVFMVMPEVGRASAPGELRRLGRGLAYVALRTRARIVPLVLGGNDELYLGREILLRVLPTLDPGELAGIAPGAVLQPGSAQEREAARRLTTAFVEVVSGAVAEVQASVEPPPGSRKRGRFLTTLFR